MPYIEPAATFMQSQRFRQACAVLEANEVPKPYILWLTGRELLSFLESVGKTPHPRDGAILLNKQYRYNFSTGRVRQVDPR